jgi:hypothetical protein
MKLETFIASAAIPVLRKVLQRRGGVSRGRERGEERGKKEKKEDDMWVRL